MHVMHTAGNLHGQPQAHHLYYKNRQAFHAFPAQCILGHHLNPCGFPASNDGHLRYTLAARPLVTRTHQKVLLTPSSYCSVICFITELNSTSASGHGFHPPWLIHKFLPAWPPGVCPPHTSAVGDFHHPNSPPPPHHALSHGPQKGQVLSGKCWSQGEVGRQGCC